MTTSEKVAYLKGLADGLGLGKETKEEKLISAIIDVLETISLDIEDLEETCLDLSEELDALSDDLSDVEDFLCDEYYCDDYDEYDDNDCCCGGEEDDCCGGEGHHHHEEGACCGGHGHHGHHGGGCGCGGHHGVLYEVTCPGCNNTITIDEEVLNLGAIECPTCGGLLEFDVEATKEDESEKTQD